MYGPLQNQITHKHHRHNKKHNQLLPVYVWVHGGSNTGGSGNGNWEVAAREYNAVVVSINYRLGPMGWFSHPALKSGNRKDDSGNFGTLDQIQALKWVQQNIRRFGGDPNNVTLAGESAGAQNVSYLMHSRLAKNYFHKAVIESNFPGIRPVSAAYKSSKQVLYNLLVADGTVTDAVAAKAYVEASMSDQDVRDYFHGKTMGEIRGVYNNPYWGGINWGDFYRDDIESGNTFVAPPIVQWTANRPEFVYAIGDGYVLPDDADFADFTRGRVYPKPMIVGTTRNENNLWNATWPFNFRAGASLDQLVSEALASGNPYLTGMGSTAAEFMENYTYGTQMIDEVCTYMGAQLSARNMARTSPWTPVYVYSFDWGSSQDKDYKIPFEDAWKFYYGAVHGAEMDFFYQNGGAESNGYSHNADNVQGRRVLSDAIESYMKPFIHNRHGYITRNDGQPARWRPWTRYREGVMIFDADHSDVDVHMDYNDIKRTPIQLYLAHLAHPNAITKDFIEYYIMWSWHWNWYPNASSHPFDTAPGPNMLFDPNMP